MYIFKNLILALTGKQILFYIIIVMQKSYSIFILEQDRNELRIFRQLPEKAEQSEQHNAIFKPLRKRILNRLTINLGPKNIKMEVEGKRGEISRKLLAFFIYPSY